MPIHFGCANIYLKPKTFIKNNHLFLTYSPNYKACMASRKNIIKGEADPLSALKRQVNHRFTTTGIESRKEGIRRQRKYRAICIMNFRPFVPQKKKWGSFAKISAWCISRRRSHVQKPIICTLLFILSGTVFAEWEAKELNRKTSKQTLILAQYDCRIEPIRRFIP